MIIDMNEIRIWIFFNILRLRQNGHHFADDILNGIFNENVLVSIKIALK